MTGTELAIFGQPVLGRSCASCRLCCTLVPVELQDDWKAANEKCKHVTSRGCGIYASRPLPCRVWSCRWLFDADTAGLRRPDKVGYAIDPQLDEIRVTDQETGAQFGMQVIQVWCDPARRDAWRDPALLAYLDKMARRHGAAAIIRWSESDALTVLAPAFSPDGVWQEEVGAMSEDVGLYAKRYGGGRPNEAERHRMFLRREVLRQLAVGSRNALGSGVRGLLQVDQLHHVDGFPPVRDVLEVDVAVGQAADETEL